MLTKVLRLCTFHRALSLSHSTHCFISLSTVFYHSITYFKTSGTVLKCGMISSQIPDFTSLLSRHHRTFASLSVQQHPQQIWHLIIPCFPLTYLPSFPVVNVSHFTSVFTACYGLFHLFTYSTYLAPTSPSASMLHHSLQCPAI